MNAETNDVTAPASEEAATLTPWRMRLGVCRNDHPDISADVHGPAGEFVADCGSHTQANANAAFIVTACNAHAELLAAVQGLQAFVGVMVGRGSDAVIPETLNTSLGVPIKIGELMRDAAAAIAKAEGR